jgi:hypothetical protein
MMEKIVKIMSMIAWPRLAYMGVHVMTGLQVSIVNVRQEELDFSAILRTPVPPTHVTQLLFVIPAFSMGRTHAAVLRALMALIATKILMNVLKV